MKNGQHCFVRGKPAIVNHCIDDDLWSVTLLTSWGASVETAYEIFIEPVETEEQAELWLERFDWHKEAA